MYCLCMGEEDSLMKMDRRHLESGQHYIAIKVECALNSRTEISCAVAIKCRCVDVQQFNAVLCILSLLLEFPVMKFIDGCLC